MYIVAHFCCWNRGILDLIPKKRLACPAWTFISIISNVYYFKFFIFSKFLCFKIIPDSQVKQKFKWNEYGGELTRKSQVKET